MKRKLIHIISEVEKSHHFEWITRELKERFTYKCILIGKTGTEHERFLNEQAVEFYALRYSSKKQLPEIIFKLGSILRKEKPEIVHTHFWIASLIGIPVASFLRVPVKVMTRHHGDLHHKYYAKGVWFDKFLNSTSDLVITPTEWTKELLVEKEGVEPAKVKVIHHGIDIEYYANVSSERVEELRKKYNLGKAGPVIGMISRFVEWKGIQYSIQAFRRILHQYPNANLILANAHGDYRSRLLELLDGIPSTNYTIIGYENDTPALYNLFDVFVHVPVDKFSESFGLIYIEALAASRPSVFTLSGIANTFIRHEVNALVVDYRNADQIYQAVTTILRNDPIVLSLKQKGKESIKPFSYRKMGEELVETYYNLLNEKGLR